jgi:hypothetical protein
MEKDHNGITNEAKRELLADIKLKIPGLINSEERADI